MDRADASFFGYAVAVAGTLAQLAVIAATVPSWSECRYDLCRGGHGEPPAVMGLWAPFIDNSGDGEGRVDQEPICPAPRGRIDRPGLADAPLPGGFDPHAYSERPIYACALVARSGDVLAVRMLRGTGDRARDFRLARAIGSWTFRPDAGDPNARSWQRVRLSSGPGSSPIWNPLTL
jgi:hypothetical protein